MCLGCAQTEKTEILVNFKKDIFRPGSLPEVVDISCNLDRATF